MNRGMKDSTQRSSVPREGVVGRDEASPATALVLATTPSCSRVLAVLLAMTKLCLLDVFVASSLAVIYRVNPDAHHF